MLDGYGQWLARDPRAIVRARTKVIVRVDDGSADAGKQIAEVIDAFKRRFRQQSVLRVDTPACVAF